MRSGAFGFILFCLLGVSDSVDGAIVWTVEEGGNGHSYTLTSQRGSWLAVEEEAQSRGGHLVSINSAEEQQFIVTRFLLTEPSHLANGRPNIFWIGLWDETPDLSFDGDFAWSDGTPIDYTNWAPEEANNQDANEEYAVINWDEDDPEYDPYQYGLWNDIDSVFVERPNTWNGARGIVEIVLPTPTGTPPPIPTATKGPAQVPTRTPTPTPIPSPSVGPVIGECHDVSGDDQIDSIDLLMVIVDEQTGNLRCDFNDDQIMDATDVLMFIPCWMDHLVDN